MNPSRIKLELFCRGAKIDASCDLVADTRPMKRTRGGLGSGLDAVLPGDVWVNIPVFEPFAQSSPFTVAKEKSRYLLLDDRRQEPLCELFVPPCPAWYEKKTSSGKPIGDIGVMQGTYFSIYPSQLCQFWDQQPAQNCRFCSVGLCLGKTESEEKSVQDVLEAVIQARKNEKITFVHFNTGYMENDRALDIVAPYVKAVKQKTGLLVGVQCPPAIDLSKYRVLKKLGANHLSFCFEIFDPQRFEEVCPGKARFFGEHTKKLQHDPLALKATALAEKFLNGDRPHPGQIPFYRALLYTLKLFGIGRVSGEIIAGLEDPLRSIAAIEFLAAMGAVSTVCVFRPCIGTGLESVLPPNPDSLAAVFARMYQVCPEHHIPIGLAPNIKTAMVLLPEEGRGFTVESGGLSRALYGYRMDFLKTVYRSLFAASRIGKG